MLEHALKLSEFQLGYCQTMVADIDDDRFAFQPLPGVHHPAWILGHLSVTLDYLPALLGKRSQLTEAWRPLFGPGSPVHRDRAIYPSKQELMSALEGCHLRAAQAVREAAPEAFALPNPAPMPQLKMLETVGQVVTLLLTTHESVHLGQLSFWRRAIGLPALF